MQLRGLAVVSLSAMTLTLAACGEDGGGDPSCAAVGVGARGYDVLAYDLAARFDWGTATLTAHEQVRIACRAQPTIELDAEVAIAAVTVDGRPAAFTVDAAAHTVAVDTGGVDGPVTLAFDYTATPSDALLLSGPRDDDPVASRVLFTDSEPDRGRRWLVGDHVPADRATFAVALTIPADHDAVANGERTGDRTSADGRVVSYAIAEPIPTYLMAFATGELDHVERTSGRVPLAVWFRRGLALDAAANLDMLAEQLATFEALLGPYPWSRYAVVLVPQYGGGMENATITFDNELSGQGVLGFGLSAHELAHQWFGDWVTMHGYDDVWVKEGMATLLAAEADRARRDRDGTGRWFGSDFNFNPDDAVVDPALTGLDKYTSGPYERAAWLMTQIRARIGDAAYWAGARKVLADHARGTITGEQFVRSFAPALDEATIARILAALPRRGAPMITVAWTPVAGGTELTFGLDDPDQLLLAPIEVGAVGADGVAGPRVALPTTVTVPDGGYLALDPDGVHPYWPYVFGPWSEYFDGVEPRLAPHAEPALTAFASRAPTQQERGLYAGLPVATPAAFTALYGALDSTEAQATAATVACEALAALTGPEAMAFAQALAPALQTPAITRYQGGLGRCGAVVPGLILGAEFEQLAAAPTAANAARLDYLMAFDYGAARTLAALAPVVTSAPSLRLRDRAVARLVAQLVPPYAPIDPVDAPTWQAFFRDRYATTTSLSRLFTVWRGSQRLRDADALPLLADRLRAVPMPVVYQVDFVCQAFDLAAPGDWAAFKDVLQPWSTLPAEVAAVLTDPGQCANRRMAPAPDADADADADAAFDRSRWLRRAHAR